MAISRDKSKKKVVQKPKKGRQETIYLSIGGAQAIDNLSSQYEKRSKSDFVSASLEYLEELSAEYGLDGNLRPNKLNIEDEYTIVPLYELITRGEKQELRRIEAVIEGLAFRTFWLKHILKVNTEDLGLLHVYGDSMYPTLKEGDILLISFNDSSFVRDISSDSTLFLVQRENEIVIRRIVIFHDEKGMVRLEIRCDNPEYKDRAGRLGEGKVIGHVLWIGRKL